MRVHNASYSEEAKAVNKIYLGLCKAGFQDIDLMLENEKYLNGLMELAVYGKDLQLNSVSISAIGLIGKNTAKENIRHEIINFLLKLLRKEKNIEIRLSVCTSIFCIISYYLSKKQFDKIKALNAEKLYKKALAEAKSKSLPQYQSDSKIMTLLTSLNPRYLQEFLQEFKLTLPSGFKIVKGKIGRFEDFYRISMDKKIDLKKIGGEKLNES